MSDPRDDLAALISSNVYKYRENTWSLNDDGSDLPGTIAGAILAAGYVKPKPPTVTPDHDIDMERAPYCTVCGRDVQWDDNTESWQH